MIDLLERAGHKAGVEPETESFPEWLDPMLATLVGEPFSDDDWVYERKLDGERCLAFVREGSVSLKSRNQKDLNETYPEIAGWLSESLDVDVVLDGEIVAFEGDTTSFEALQSRMQIKDPTQARETDVDVYYYVFDVLHIDGASTREIPLRERKQVLRELIEFRDPVRFTPHRNADGEDFFEEACADGWEGLIAKNATAEYVGSRSRKWLKLKCVSRQEFVVGGYTDPQGERTGFGALLIGYYDGDDLVYAGKVGTGYDERTLRRLGDKLRSLKRSGSPFSHDSAPSGAHWVEPRLIAEVGFTEWTSAGRLRHPRFIGLRTDKPPEDVVREKPS